MRVSIFLLLAFFVIAGCATVDRSEIKSKLMEIDRSDGINKDEAVILTQNFLIERDMDKYWRLAKPNVENYGDFWAVVFSPVNSFALDYDQSKPLRILILKADGTIPSAEELKVK